MNKFLADLLAALELDGLKTKESMVYNEALFLMKPRKDSRINLYRIDIKAAKGKPHCLDVDEIWIGQDAEGNPWSDNMGGLLIDCNGMNCGEAIAYTVGKLRGHFGHAWFN